MIRRGYEKVGAGRVRSAAETAETRREVRGFWHHCDFGTGTLAEAYLLSRGIGWAVQCPNIRFRPECRHPSGRVLPAMVALVLDADGNVCAAHKTFLEPPGRKAGVDPVKLTRGSFAGGAIRLHPPGVELVVGEGIETTASAASLLGIPGWAAIACGNLGWRMVLPPKVRSVVIAADHDAPGQRAADKAARRWMAEGRTVRIAMPDLPGQDFSDLLQEKIAREAPHA